MRALASFFNDLGNTQREKRNNAFGIAAYKVATILLPTWSVPWYNLGLLEKYRAHWPESLRYNQQAARLDPSDEASWWNLGIAATALRNWPEARRAWAHCEITLLEEEGETSMPRSTACVRLDPDGRGEVVWGTRLDPARIRVRNVPLPDSGRRYGDILLNDGAMNGTRTSGGNEFPVFDELDIWQPSTYSTFNVTLHATDDEQEKLVELCDASDVALEDWGTIRALCAACSRGNPGAHVCSENIEVTGDKNFGFAATSRDVLLDVLDRWTSEYTEANYSDPELALLAK